MTITSSTSSSSSRANSQRKPIERDDVGHDHPAVVATCGERHPVVHSQQILGRVPVRNNHGDVVHQTHELRRHLVERSGDQPFELTTRDHLHGRNLPSSPGSRRACRRESVGSRRGRTPHQRRSLSRRPHPRAARRGHTSATPLCIVAGAGSGKTRVLTRRIAWQAATGTIDPRRVLAVTFTRRAAGELRRRTRALGLRDDVAAGTFHSIALAILRNHWKDSGRRAPELLERRMSFLARNTATSTAHRSPTSTARSGGPVPARRPISTPTRQGCTTSPRRSLSFVADIYGQYEEAKRKRKLVDFDDLSRSATPP